MVELEEKHETVGLMLVCREALEAGGGAERQYDVLTWAQC